LAARREGVVGDTDVVDRVAVVIVDLDERRGVADLDDRADRAGRPAP